MVNPDLLIPNHTLLIFIPSPLSSLTRRKVVTVPMECIRGLRAERNGVAQSLPLDAWPANWMTLVCVVLLVFLLPSFKQILGFSKQEL